MPKRTDISKILILGFGCIACVVTGEMPVANLAFAGCVTVTSGKDYEPSSLNARITTSREGKPLQNVKIESDASNGQRRFLLSTNDQGIVFLPELQPGKQCIIATTFDNVTARLCLDVSPEGKDNRSSFSIELPPSPTGRELARAEKMPVLDRVQEFTGIVQDESGAPVPSTKIQILLKGSKDEAHVIQIEADATGHFSARLPDGVYMSFFRSSGFVTQIEVLEVGKQFDSRDLRVLLKVESC
jgi:hypothetical protein